jgi:hypothetical protein
MAPSLAQLQNLPSTAQGVVAHGQSLFDSADSLSNGDYAGLAVAASGLIGDLPDGAIKSTLSDLASAGEGALMGAALGSVVPGWGTAIGAVVGAIAGLVEGMVSSPAVIEGDPRPTAEQYLFPATANGAQYSVIPYNVIHPRADNMPSLPFYQTPSGLYQLWSPLFNFCTSWTSPPQVKGYTKPSQNSRQAAWALVQWHEGVDAITKAYAFKTAPNPAMVQAVQQARVLVGTLLGGDDIALRAFNRLSQLYGMPQAFSPNFPPYPPFPSLSTFVFLYGQRPQVDQILYANNSYDPVSRVIIPMHIADKYPLDWTYYLRGARYDSNTGNGAILREVENNWNIALWFPDTLRFTMAECAVLEYNDTNVMHFLLSLMWLEKRGHMFDAVKWGKPVYPHHPNLARLTGLVGERVRAATPKHNPHTSAVRKSLTSKRIVKYTHPNHNRPASRGHGIALGLGVGVALWGLYRITRS